MLSCLLIKSHSRSEIVLLFFQYNSTIISTTIILATIADSVRTVLVTVIQASALYYDVITYDVIKLLPPLEQGLPPCCPPCKMNLVTPLPRGQVFEVLGLGLGSPRPWILRCPRLEDSIFFENSTLRLFSQNASCFKKKGPNNDKHR